MKNKNIKLIIIPLTILMIFTCIVISMQTYSQYKKISVITNEKISEIIEYIIKENPSIDTKKIIQILNSNEYKVGEEELKKYGINIEEINSIIDEAFNVVNPKAQSDMGKIMKEISPKLKNRADMGEVNKIIKEKLSQI